MKTDLRGPARSQDSFETHKKSLLKGVGEKSYLQAIFQKSIEMGATHDAGAMQAVAAAEILRARGPSLGAEGKAALGVAITEAGPAS